MRRRHPLDEAEVKRIFEMVSLGVPEEREEVLARPHKKLVAAKARRSVWISHSSQPTATRKRD